MMRKAPPDAPNTQRIISNLHLCFPQNACFFILPALIKEKLHSFLFILQ